jgi:hypothetical protein
MALLFFRFAPGRVNPRLLVHLRFLYRQTEPVPRRLRFFADRLIPTVDKLKLVGH